MQEAQLALFILLIIVTLIDIIRMRYGNWKFPHLFHGRRYNSSLGIVFAILFSYSVFIVESYSNPIKIICMLITDIFYIILYMSCYYILDKKKWEIKYKSERKEKERQEYLMKGWFKIKDIISNDYITETDQKQDNTMYTIVLEDMNGNEKRIQTVDVSFYERKMLAGEHIQIGKIRRHNIL